MENQGKIKVRCPYCEQKLRMDASIKEVTCPKCNGQFGIEEEIAPPPTLEINPEVKPAIPIHNHSVLKPDERDCPMCGEIIRYEATFCRYCKNNIHEVETISCKCPRCAESFKTDANYLGKEVSCPICDQSIIVKSLLQEVISAGDDTMEEVSNEAPLEGIVVRRGRLLGTNQPDTVFTCQNCQKSICSPANIYLDNIECPKCSNVYSVSLITKGNQQIDIFTFNYNAYEIRGTSYGISVAELLSVFKKEILQIKGQITNDMPQEGYIGGVVFGTYYQLYVYETKNSGVAIHITAETDGSIAEAQKIYDVFIQNIWANNNLSEAEQKKQISNIVFDGSEYRFNQINYIIGVMIFVGLAGGVFMSSPLSEICWIIFTIALITGTGLLTFKR